MPRMRFVFENTLKIRCKIYKCKFYKKIIEVGPITNIIRNALDSRKNVSVIIPKLTLNYSVPY